MAAVKWTSEAKFCSWLLAGTSGDRWMAASCWEPCDRSLEWEGNSLLCSEEASPLPWFLRANACRDSRALPKLPWCWSCWRIHLDNPKGKKKKIWLQNDSSYIRYFTSVNSTPECKYFCVGIVSKISRVCSWNYNNAIPPFQGWELDLFSGSILINNSKNILLFLLRAFPFFTSLFVRFKLLPCINIIIFLWCLGVHSACYHELFKSNLHRVQLFIIILTGSDKNLNIMKLFTTLCQIKSQ